MPANEPPRRYALESLFGPGREGMTSHTPHAAYLGIRVVETGPAFAVCAVPFREELIGDPRRRVIFGGAITTLIDHASGLAVACAVAELTSIATIDHAMQENDQLARRSRTRIDPRTVELSGHSVLRWGVQTEAARPRAA